MKKSLMIYFIAITAIISSCSTISVLPREGTAAKFNLATVEYVNTVSQNQKDELVQRILPQIQAVLDSLLINDRKDISNLDSLLAEQEAKINSVIASLDTTNSTVQMISGKFLRDLSEIKSSTRSLQMYVDQLKAGMESLPVVALQELNVALELYLKQNSQVEQQETPPVETDN